MIRLLLAVVLGSAPLLAMAAVPNEQQIAKLYARGLAGDQQAVVDCITTLGQVLAARPNDQLARVYLGSAETLRSRDLPIGLAKLSTLRRGMAHMDEAAGAAPENARVQLMRAVTYESFPRFLGRAEVARAALEALVATIEKNPAKLSPGDRQLLYLNAGTAAQNAGNAAGARQLWERGAALQADPRLTAELRAALAPSAK